MLTNEMSGSYNLILVALSFAIATLASFSAIEMSGHVLHGSGRGRSRVLAAAAVVMGVGVWSMHFVGMLAFSLPIHVSYTVPIVAVSVVPAIVSAGIALAMVNRPRVGPLLLLAAGTTLGAGIGGMHYVGMYAMHMQADLRFDLTIVGASVVIAVVAASGALFALSQAIQEPDESLIFRALGAMCMGIGITGLHYIAMQAAHFTANSATASGTMTVDISTIGAAAIAIVTLALSSIAIVLVRANRGEAMSQALAASAS